jgi:flagellin
MLSLSLNSFYATQAARQSDNVSKSMEKLSSGKRLNKASDDAAGLSIAEGLRAQVLGSKQASRNIQDAINIIKIGEDGVAGLFPVMQRMRELILQSANSTYTDKDRAAMQDEIDELKNLIPQAFYVAHSARIDLDFQVGPNPGDMVSVDFNGLRNTMYNLVLDSYGYEELYNSPFGEMLVAAFGSPAPQPSDPVPPVAPFTAFPPGTTFAEAFPKKLVINPGTDANIQQSLALVDNGNNGLVAQDAYLGAMQNTLEHSLNNVENSEVNLAASESQIRDLDMADEMTELTKSQVLQQSAMAMITQANARPLAVLELLRGGGQ